MGKVFVPYGKDNSIFEYISTNGTVPS